MSNTTHGSYRITPSNNIKAYDKLPAALREAHRNCFHDFACPPDVKAVKAGKAVEQLIDDLISTDAHFVRADAKKDWKQQAPDYLAVQPPRRRRDWLDQPPRSRL